MPILTLQKRLRQAGRIRIGAKVATKNGSRPSKLETFRITSADQSIIEAAAEIYGGDPQVWDGAAVGTQFEVYTKATEIDVIVPPSTIAFSQFLELWGGGGCLRRCDGVTNLLTDSPCICDQENPECRPTTRLNVILAALDGIGVFRLESHGHAAAAELGGSMEVLQIMQSHGISMVPGRLMLEQRQSKRLDEKGVPQTFNFVVPVLDFKVSIASLAAASVPPQARLSSVTPIQTETLATPSIAEQVLAAKTPKERAHRSNAAAALPSTGLKPRGMSAKPDIATESHDVGKSEKAQDDRTPGGASKRSLRRLLALINGNKDIVVDNDEDRHAWAEVALGYPVKSFNDLDQPAISKLNDIAEGKTPLIPDEPKQYETDDPQRTF